MDYEQNMFSANRTSVVNPNVLNNKHPGNSMTLIIGITGVIILYSTTILYSTSTGQN